ncbi:unnamed protein product [Rotaria magnacalcarata]|uniref:Integrase catalytic domain-containing protein n=2 Tax=Rotaria magnacalcarata TaxID=392030 RepID=A0A819IY86_9BILA|nr:unnamed protein product [Rotaria magnacalcarata]
MQSSVQQNEIISDFGCPVEILTGRGNNFTTTILNSYFTLIDIKHILTSAYRPRSNGVIERFNRLFGGMLAKYVGDHDINKWDEYIDHALFPCRVRQHHATGGPLASSFIMMMGSDSSFDIVEFVFVFIIRLRVLNPRVRVLRVFRPALVYGVEAKLPGDEDNNISCRAQQLDQPVQQRGTVVHQRLN